MAELIGHTVLFAGSETMEGWVASGETLKTTNGEAIRYLTKTGTSSWENDCMIGQIVLYPYNKNKKVPEGWALCNGGAVNESNYKTLYAVIGNAFGGGLTSFNLPNIASTDNLKYIICIDGTFPL